MLDLQLEPYETTKEKSFLPPLRHSILRTSGRLRIGSIKKYVLQKLGLKDSKSSVRHIINHLMCLDGLMILCHVHLIYVMFSCSSSHKIEILCNDEPVGNEHSLTFILRTRWFYPNKLLTLHYRLLEDNGDSFGHSGQVA